jgi:uncharacterized membrane protein YGL010W
MAGDYGTVSSHREAAMLGNKPMSQWVGEYGHSHQHPINRVCHTFGIPMIAVSVVLAIGMGTAIVAGQAGDWVATGWVVVGALFVVGWILQFVGHAVEGKPPEFLKDWRFLFVGLRWWFAKVAGRG